MGEDWTLSEGFLAVGKDSGVLDDDMVVAGRKLVDQEHDDRGQQEIRSELHATRVHRESHAYIEPTL